MAAFVPAAALPVTNRRARAVVSSRMGADGPAGRVSRAQFVRLLVGTAAAAAAAGVSGGVEPAHAGFGIGGLFSGGDSDNAVRGLDSSKPDISNNPAEVQRQGESAKAAMEAAKTPGGYNPPGRDVEQSTTPFVDRKGSVAPGNPPGA
eukprot:contig_24186_g5956